MILTKEQREAIEDAIAMYENCGQCNGPLERDVALEDCDDCAAGPGEPCEDTCNRAAMCRHRDTLKEMPE